MPSQTATAEADPCVTAEELAVELNVAKPTVYGWRHRGIGPRGFILGGSLRYRRSEVDRWLREAGDTAAVHAQHSAV